MSRSITVALNTLNVATSDFLTGVVSQLNYDNALSSRMLKKSKGVDGGEKIRVGLEYGEENVSTRGEYEQYNLQPKELLDAAFYDWKNIGGDMTISKKKLKVQNKGKAQLIDIAKTKTKNLSRTMRKKFSEYLFSTDVGPKDPDSLYKIAGTTDNTVGGIDASTCTKFNWNPEVLDLTSESLTEANLLDATHDYCIENVLRKIFGRLTYENDKPTIALLTQGLWDIYEKYLQSQRRYEGKAGEADGGFQYLKFRNVPMFVDNNVPGGKMNTVSAGNAMMFVLNEEFLGYRHAEGVKFEWQKWQKKQDQPIYFSLLDWYGAFVTSRRDRQGSVQGLPTDSEINS